MAPVRTLSEQSYRSTTNRLGITLLAFELLLNVIGVVVAVIAIVLELIPGLDMVTKDCIDQISYGLLYVLIFVLPALLYFLISGRQRTAPILFATKWRMETVAYLFVGLAVISATAHINADLVSVFDFTVYLPEELLPTVATTPTNNYQLVLMIFTTAIVPAFVEELLFRGIVLSNLMPYGKTTAVLASAFLFGIMHQNPAQFLYATAAGLVLGYIYIKTRSIWTVILLHFVNNFISVIETVLEERLLAHTAELALLVLEAGIFLLGLLAAVYLILRYRDQRRAVLAQGCFEMDLQTDTDVTVQDLSFGTQVRLFFSIPMIVFLVICALMMIPNFLALSLLA